MVSEKENLDEKKEKRKRNIIKRDINNLPLWAYLRVHEICDCLGCAKSTLYKKISDGEFPPLVKIGERSSGQTVEMTKKACEKFSS